MRIRATVYDVVTLTVTLTFEPKVNRLRHSLNDYYCVKIQVVPIRGFRFIVPTYTPHIHIHTHTHRFTDNTLVADPMVTGVTMCVPSES